MQHDKREKYVTAARTFGTSRFFFFITFPSLKDLPKTGDRDALTYIHNNIIPRYPYQPTLCVTTEPR